MINLSGKNCVVTGANRGIGLAISNRLKSLDANVVGIDVETDKDDIINVDITDREQIKDFAKIRSTLDTVQKEKEKLEKDKNDLSKRLGKHDIGNLAENKPKLVEKIINGASKKALRCIEIASGSPLTEEELNGKPNKECPSFWPDTVTD